MLRKREGGISDVCMSISISWRRRTTRARRGRRIGREKPKHEEENAERVENSAKNRGSYNGRNKDNG